MTACFRERRTSAIFWPPPPAVVLPFGPPVRRLGGCGIITAASSVSAAVVAFTVVGEDGVASVVENVDGVVSAAATVVLIELLVRSSGAKERIRVEVALKKSKKSCPRKVS